MQSYKFEIIGIVQGVYYRKNIQANATKENFSGYVKNLKNGNVEVAVTCEKTQLDKFLAILKKGSPKSVVNDIKQYTCDEVFTSQFEIKY